MTAPRKNAAVAEEGGAKGAGAGAGGQLTGMALQELAQVHIDVSRAACSRRPPSLNIPSTQARNEVNESMNPRGSLPCPSLPHPCRHVLPCRLGFRRRSAACSPSAVGLGRRE